MVDNMKRDANEVCPSMALIIPVYNAAAYLGRIPWGGNRMFYVMRLVLPVLWAYGISSVLTNYLQRMRCYFFRVCQK